MEVGQQTAGSWVTAPPSTPPPGPWSSAGPLVMALHGMPGIQPYEDQLDSTYSSLAHDADSISTTPADFISTHSSSPGDPYPHDGPGHDLVDSTSSGLGRPFSSNHATSLSSASETTPGDGWVNLFTELEAHGPLGFRGSATPEYPPEGCPFTNDTNVKAQQIGCPSYHVTPSDPVVLEADVEHKYSIRANWMTTMKRIAGGTDDQTSRAGTSWGSIFRGLWGLGRLWRPSASPAAATVAGPITLGGGVDNTSNTVSRVAVSCPSDTLPCCDPEDWALALLGSDGPTLPNPTESTIRRYRLQVSEPSDLPHLPPWLATRLSSSDDQAPEGKTSGFDRVGSLPPQSLDLARDPSSPIPPEMPTSFDLYSRTLGFPALPSGMHAPAYHTDPPDRSNNPAPPTSEPPLVSATPDLQPRTLAVFSSRTTKHNRIVISETGRPPVDRGDTPNMLAASNSTPNVADDCVEQFHGAVYTRIVSLLFASICQPCQHDKDEGQVHTLTQSPKGLPMTTMVTTRAYAILDLGDGVGSRRGIDKLDEHVMPQILWRGVGNTLVAPRSHFIVLDYRTNAPTPKPIFKGPNAPRLSRPMVINTNNGGWVLLSGDINHLWFSPLLQYAVPLRELPRRLPTGLKGRCTVRLVVRRNQSATTIPVLASSSFPIRPHRRKLRVGNLLGLICPYAYSWDPPRPGPAFQFSYASGSSQTPGNTYPRFEDGSGIWSGQGPGPIIDPLLSRELESWGLSGHLGDHIPLLNSPLLTVPYGSLADPFTQLHHSAPDPPVPLQQGALRELLSKVFSAGLALGLSLGSARTTPQESSFNGFKSQQSNPPGVQEGNTSTIQRSTLDMPLDLSYDEATRLSALPLDGFGAPAHRTFGLPGAGLLVDMPEQPIVNPGDIVSTQDLADDPALDAWLQQPTPIFGTHSITDSQSIGPLITDRLSFDGDIGLGTEACLTMNSLDGIAPPRPTQSTIPPNTGPESHPPGSQIDQGGGGLHHCSLCGKGFRRPYLLNDHISMHNGEKLFDCTFEGCGERYRSYSNAMRHLKKAHPDAAHLPPPSRKRARVESPGQTPEAGPSNHDAFRGNTRSSPTFISYTPSATRHKKRRRN